MSKNKKLSVLIIESEDVDDPGSEGRFMRHLLNLMEISNIYRKAKSRDEFLSVMGEAASRADMIHIATHGETKEVGSNKKKTFTGFWTPAGTVSIKDFSSVSVDMSEKTVVSTACYSGQKTAREKFKASTGCRHYIAPVRGIYFYNASLMCHILYHKHLQIGKSVEKAFSEYDKRYKNPHDFCLE